MKSAIKTVAQGAFAAAAFAGAALAELPVEDTPNVKSLPANYPDSWVFALDGNFFGISAGKAVLFDAAAEIDHYKGSIALAEFGFLAQSKARGEIYAVETFYARGTRGDRTDVLTIYDKSTLTPKGEVVLPAQRMQMLTERGAFQLSADGKYAYVFNFTPASSVSVIDLDRRKTASVIDIPGCAHAFATGSGFASLCGNGAVASTVLDAKGGMAKQTMSEPFNDLDKDPMFTRPAVIGGTAYFPTYGGMIQPVDLSGETAAPGSPWPIEQPTESPGRKWLGLGGKKAPSTFKPSGWQLATADAAGRLYVIMRRDARDGDHDTGGDEVWAIDPATRKTVQRYKLQAEAFVIEATRGPKPLLVALRADQSFDVYDATSGAWLRRIGGQMVMTAFGAMAAE